MAPAAASTLATATATPPRSQEAAEELQTVGDRSEAKRIPPEVEGEPEERCRAPWRERRSQWWRGEAPREVDRPWSLQRWEKASCG
jgi:hypothetical protein